MERVQQHAFEVGDDLMTNWNKRNVIGSSVNGKLMAPYSYSVMFVSSTRDGYFVTAISNACSSGVRCLTMVQSYEAVPPCFFLLDKFRTIAHSPLCICRSISPNP